MEKLKHNIDYKKELKYEIEEKYYRFLRRRGRLRLGGRGGGGLLGAVLAFLLLVAALEHSLELRKGILFLFRLIRGLVVGRGAVSLEVEHLVQRLPDKLRKSNDEVDLGAKSAQNNSK